MDKRKKTKQGDKKMNTEKIFGVVLEDGVFKSYELRELEGSGVVVNYVIMCSVAQINNVVRMLNNIMKEVK